MSDQLTPQSGVRLSPDATTLVITRPPLGGVWTTLPTVTDADKIRAVNLSTAPGKTAESVMGQDILIEHLLLKGIAITNPGSGEVSECILALLIPPTGDPVQCVSWGVIQSLETIASIVGRPPWRPPLVVRLKQLRTKSKMLTYQLELLGFKTEVN